MTPSNVKQQIYRLPSPPADRFPPRLRHTGCQGAQRALLPLPPRPFGAIQVIPEHEGAAPPRKSLRSVFVKPGLRAPGAHGRTRRGVCLPEAVCPGIPTSTQTVGDPLTSMRPSLSGPAQSRHSTRVYARARALRARTRPPVRPWPRRRPSGAPTLQDKCGNRGVRAARPPARGASEPPCPRVRPARVTPLSRAER